MQETSSSSVLNMVLDLILLPSSLIDGASDQWLEILGGSRTDNQCYEGCGPGLALDIAIGGALYTHNEVYDNLI